MSKKQIIKSRLFGGILTVICIVTATVVLVSAAYFAKGEFKDVFVNKKDYFSANVLYNIKSTDAEKHEVGSSGVEREIMIYNYDMSTGDFNSFDVTFDVYAWLDKPLTEGKSYLISTYGVDGQVAVNTEEHTEPVFRDLTLTGGQRSTVTLTVNFGFEDEDLTDAPGLNVVAVPTFPKRLSSFLLGSVIRPTRSDAFNVNSYFDDTGSVEDYAAFTYHVNTVGIAPTGDKIRIKWKSDALILIRENGEEPYILDIQEGVFENGFDRMIEWEAQSDHTDYFVFFRNTENEMWNTEDQTWDLVRAQIVTEYVRNT